MIAKDRKSALVTFLLYWLANTTVLYASGVFAKEVVQLGSWYMSFEAGAAVPALILALLILTVEPVLTHFHIHVKHNITWVLLLWVVNSAALFIIRRAASYTGIGLKAFWVAIALGGTLNYLQLAAWKIVHHKS